MGVGVAVKIVFHQVHGPQDLVDYTPLGFGYLASFLKEVGVVEAECSVAATPEQMIDARPDVVGLSASSQNYGLALNLAERLRASGRAKLILGGPHITCLPASFRPVFDCGVLGEGEDTFQHLMSVLQRTGDLSPEHLALVPGIVFRNGGDLVRTEPREPLDPLDQVPPPDWEILPETKMAHVVTGRGCPYNCAFCNSRTIWGRYRGFTAERIAQDLQTLIARGRRKIHFYDDLFIADLERLIRLADVVEDLGLADQAEFSCSVRADLLTESVAEVLVRLGVTAVTFGLESADEATNRRLRKDYDLPLIRQALNLLARYEINCAVSAIVGEPEESMESMRRTYGFLAEQAVGGRVTGAEIHVLAPMPGADYWDQAVERGLIGDWETFDWSRLAAPWRGLLLNPLLEREAGRLVAWDHYLRRLFAALHRPLIMILPETEDLEIEIDPDLLRAIFLLVDDDPDASEALEQGPVDLLRFGRERLWEQLAEIVGRFGETPLVVFAPESALASTAVIRACKLAMTVHRQPFVRSRVGAFPLMANLSTAMKLGRERFLALVRGDESALPDNLFTAQPSELRRMPLADLTAPYEYAGSAAQLLDQYAAGLANQRGG